MNNQVEEKDVTKIKAKKEPKKKKKKTEDSKKKEEKKLNYQIQNFEKVLITEKDNFNKSQKNFLDSHEIKVGNK